MPSCAAAGPNRTQDTAPDTECCLLCRSGTNPITFVLVLELETKVSFTITRAFSWLKVPESALTFKTQYLVVVEAFSLIEIFANLRINFVSIPISYSRAERSSLTLMTNCHTSQSARAGCWVLGWAGKMQHVSQSTGLLIWTGRVTDQLVTHFQLFLIKLSPPFQLKGLPVFTKLPA